MASLLEMGGDNGTADDRHARRRKPENRGGYQDEIKILDMGDQQEGAAAQEEGRNSALLEPEHCDEKSAHGAVSDTAKEKYELHLPHLRQ